MNLIRSIFKDPVTSEMRTLLAQRWQSLPEDLRLENQVVGRHWAQCGYITGPSYCSFGCSHCYLPRGANKFPMPELDEMKAQIRANRRMLGPGGNIQITGGDLVDAYLAAGKEEELIEIVRFADEVGLVPMLMTHGQSLLDNPDFLIRLVTRGRLRKISIHIDTTQAGRRDYPRGGLTREADLNPVRDAFRDLLLNVSRQTGKKLTGAQTVTVTERNIDTIGDIFHWLAADRNNSRVFRTISFQTEAATGRTSLSESPVDDGQVWEEVCRGTGLELGRDTLVFGHPDCSSLAILLVDSRQKRFTDLMPARGYSRSFWSYLVSNFGGIGGRGTNRMEAHFRKLSLLFHHPEFLWIGTRFVVRLIRDSPGMGNLLTSWLRRDVGSVKIVMHNFIDDNEVMAKPSSTVIQQRLDACSFRSPYKIDGEWQAVPMCLMNSKYRG